MSITKSFFDFRVYTDCGFPSITLDGTKADWENLKDRVQKMSEFMTDSFAK